MIISKEILIIRFFLIKIKTQFIIKNPDIILMKFIYVQ